MRYSLVVCNGNRFQRELKEYSNVPGFKTDEKTLEGITSFTSKFNSLIELKTFLTEAGILKTTEWNKNIAIGEFNNSSYPRTLFFNLTFQEDKVFLNRDYLIKYYQSHLEDAKFMKEFYYQFHNNNWGNKLFRTIYLELEHKSNLDNDLKTKALLEMKRFIYEYSSYNNWGNKLFRTIYLELERNGKLESVLKAKALKEMATFIYEYSSYHNRVKGYFGEDFKRIKLLAGFAINYEKRFNPQKTNNNQNISLESLKLELQNLYTLLEDNPNEEEKEAYISRIKDIKGELQAIQNLNKEAKARKRYLKSPRKDPYAN